MKSDIKHTANARHADVTEQGQTKFGRKRFSPGPYAFDLSTAGDLPLQMNGQASTFGEVYRKLRGLKIKEVKNDTYVTEEGQSNLDGSIGEWPMRATIQKLIELIRQGIDPYAVTWFYYGHDHSRDADECHEFFAVHNNKIVAEGFVFSSEEPQVLKLKSQGKEGEYIWNSEQYFGEALELYWYRKFYTETMTGQLMVLRPDEPILYHYDRPPAPSRADETNTAMDAKGGASESKLKQWLSLYAVSMVIGLYTAFVFMVMWNWFVAQTLNFHELSFWQALGLFWLIGLLRGIPEEQHFTSKNRWETLFMVLDYCVPGERLETLRQQVKEKTEMMWTDAVGEVIGHAIGITVTLGLGWIVHSLVA
jgi:hypothetical protein